MYLIEHSFCKFLNMADNSKRIFLFGMTETGKNQFSFNFLTGIYQNFDNFSIFPPNPSLHHLLALHKKQSKRKTKLIYFNSVNIVLIKTRLLSLINLTKNLKKPKSTKFLSDYQRYDNVYVFVFNFLFSNSLVSKRDMSDNLNKIDINDFNEIKETY